MIAVVQSAASMRAGFKARQVSIIRSAMAGIGWPPAHQASTGIPQVYGAISLRM